MARPKEGKGQVNATLLLEDLELLAGIADAAGHRPGRMAALMLMEHLNAWIAENPKLEKDRRERGARYLREKGDADSEEPPPRGKSGEHPAKRVSR